MLLPWYERPIRQRSQFTMNGNSVVKTSHYCLFSQEFCHGSRKWKITQVEVLVQRHCDKNGHFIGDLPPGLVFVSPAAASIPWCFDPSARWSSQIGPNCPEFSFTLVFILYRDPPYWTFRAEYLLGMCPTQWYSQEYEVQLCYPFTNCIYIF